MSKPKVLFINTEITPYLPETRRSLLGRHLPQSVQEAGHEIRTFMPRFGVINERRNQLHEVIRLSGMNLIVNETDHPLIIKVASIQAARMQVYFIDNEEYFTRKGTYGDMNSEYDDNAERCAFFARGVIETIRKLRWKPDIVYCQGWFAAIAPLYIKKSFAEDPCFRNVRVVYSYFNNPFKGKLPEGFNATVKREGVTKADLKEFKDKSIDCMAMNKLAVKFSDALILNDDTADAQALREYAEAHDIPVYEDYNEELDAQIYTTIFDELAVSAPAVPEPESEPVAPKRKKTTKKTL